MAYATKSFLWAAVTALILLPASSSLAQGNVYLVLGSDTGIWDGLNVDTYHDYYGFSLYTDPSQNAYKVMNPSFRTRFTDSYGQMLKLTWWVMGGNTFRYATNTNVPLNNTMVLYLIKKYHGDAITKCGDEISLHYHDWIWSDYNGDGKYYWNQSTNFAEYKEDFDLIMAQFLLEEDVYPVSFRSGWHYMNNEWQNYLNGIIPFSMHDDYPNVRSDTIEPLDNIYDWSKSSSEFVPFHPSTSDYQLPGDGKGWDNRSIYMASMDTTLMDHVFSQAHDGIDQVVCTWAHLPESNYPDNVARIDSIVHICAAKFPDVKFRYCTAVEAMQRWMKATGLSKPNLNLQYEQNADKIDLVVTTDKPIFQTQPFVAIKDKDENYSIVQCCQVGQNHWKSVESFDFNSLAKAGAAVTDTLGNLATAFINFLPDDIYIDNADTGYSEVKGNWSTKTNTSWGTDSRQAILGAHDSVEVAWAPKIERSCYYSLSVQVPQVTNPVDHVLFKIYSGGQIIDSMMFSSPLPANQWVYLGTVLLDSLKATHIEETAYCLNGTGEVASADVMKLSALIKDTKLSIPQSPVDFGMVSQEDSVYFGLELRNDGVKSLAVSGFSSPRFNITSTQSFPITIPAMGRVTVPLLFHAGTKGNVSDTFYVFSNDSLNSPFPVRFMAVVKSYFKVIDNEDSLHYKESGTWNYSNGWAFGSTSRYATLHQVPPASATYSAILPMNGVYDIEEIVPTTVNACLQALYVLSVDGVPVDSVYANQNQGSGNWATICHSFLPAGVDVELKVMDSGENTANVVLRTDAVQFSLVKDVDGVGGQITENVPRLFKLEQNYPNPFNPTTTIPFAIPDNETVSLMVYDVLGRTVGALVNRQLPPGKHKVVFNGSLLPSGVYICVLRAGPHGGYIKILLLK